MKTALMVFLWAFALVAQAEESACLKGLSEVWEYPAGRTYVIVLDHTTELNSYAKPLLERMSLRAGDKVFIYGFGLKDQLIALREAAFAIPPAPQMDEVFLPQRHKERLIACLNAERNKFISQVTERLNVSMSHYSDDDKGRSHIALSLREALDQHRDENELTVMLVTDGMENSQNSRKKGGVSFYKDSGLKPASSADLAKELGSLLLKGSLPGHIQYQLIGIGMSSKNIQFGAHEIILLKDAWELALRNAGTDRVSVSHR